MTGFSTNNKAVTDKNADEFLTLILKSRRGNSKYILE